jgi:hypothetical protein
MLTLWLIFVAVFLAELGDKTQLAKLLFAADQHVRKLGVFAASSAALVLSSLLAVLMGGQLSAYVSPRALKLLAGVGFVAIGIWEEGKRGQATFLVDSVGGPSARCASKPKGDRHGHTGAPKACCRFTQLLSVMNS